ncbi:MAG: L-lactate permease [Nitriliruptoraceae bacterium]
MSWPWWAALGAAVPLTLLTVLVLRRLPVTRAAWIAVAATGLLATTVFGLDAAGIAVAIVRGIWTGVWILLIVLPALLLYEILNRSGALDQLADASDHLAPTEGRRLLLLAWVLPSFLQGAAGYGAPIAMAAPLLVRRGMAPAAAVAACLVGYQWSVTFGSMGSSYFVAAATARLDQADAADFALRTGIVLGITAIISGLLLLTRVQRARGDMWRMLVIGGIMATTLGLVVLVQPALGSIAAGLAGLAACWWLLPGRGDQRPSGGHLVTAALPYITLTGAAVIGFAFPPVRTLFDRVPELAPVLPGAAAAFGYVTPDSAVSPIFRPLLHPLPYVMLAVVVALIAFRRKGWWHPTMTHPAAVAWLVRGRGVSLSILGLTVLSAIMTDAGMIAALADSLASALGLGFLAVSAPLGGLGTILTGSTTASNALFSSLQAEVAAMLAIAPAIMLVGQTAGGNVGNTLAPGIAMVGAAATGAPEAVGDTLRRNFSAAIILAVAVTLMLAAQVWLLR